MLSGVGGLNRPPHIEPVRHPPPPQAKEDFPTARKMFESKIASRPAGAFAQSAPIAPYSTQDGHDWLKSLAYRTQLVDQLKPYTYNPEGTSNYNLAQLKAIYPNRSDAELLTMLGQPSPSSAIV